MPTGALTCCLLRFFPGYSSVDVHLNIVGCRSSISRFVHNLLALDLQRAHTSAVQEVKLLGSICILPAHLISFRRRAVQHEKGLEESLLQVNLQHQESVQESADGSRILKRTLARLPPLRETQLEVNGLQLVGGIFGKGCPGGPLPSSPFQTQQVALGTTEAAGAQALAQGLESIGTMAVVHVKVPQGIKCFAGAPVPFGHRAEQNEAPGHGRHESHFASQLGNDQLKTWWKQLV
mmetsp:Transcript_21212/g.50450  ORF Transcript_21212/g.50450 Transcript_21212/m.50450 type:complete len:235 (-) Transcript_21212:2168-2872(-)